MSRSTTSRSVVAVLGLLAMLAGPLAATVTAAEPSSGTLTPEAPLVSWSGVATQPDPLFACTDTNPSCDWFDLTLDTSSDPQGFYDLTVEIVSATPRADFDLFLYDADGNQLRKSTNSNSQEKLTLPLAASGDYRVAVHSWLTAPGDTYVARASIAEGFPPLGELAAGDVRWTYDADVQVSAEVPLRVVLVGFDEGEFTHDDVFSMIPDAQQVGTLYRWGEGSSSADSYDLFGADTLVNHGRAYYDSAETAPLLPIEYRWVPELIHADEAYARALFTEMMSNSVLGDYASANTRNYLERYNASRGATRVEAGGPEHAVAPGADVRFIDAEAVEQWVAANGDAVGLDLTNTAGNAGYTVFVLNTFDGTGSEVFPTDEYHNFKIVRPDPDTGKDDGIDWARIWGGTYRFMMVDLGAAPNPYEAETWGNRNRAAWGSAGYDAPIWEYRANAPRPVTPARIADGGPEAAVTPSDSWDHEAYAEVIARTVNEAVNYRFFHSYLYEPRPRTGKFWLSDNIWHDRNARLFESDLEKLYDQQAAIAGLSTLTPYFEFGGDVAYEYLFEEGPGYVDDQAALDRAKENGDDVAGAKYTAMHTETMMDYVDGTPRLLRNGDGCFTPVPTVQVVVEGHYAWALPVIVAGIAPNRAGIPWGFLNSVSDVTKWNGADRDESMKMIHPQAFSGTFTYTTVHEASHYLGLAHPHDTVGASRGANGEPVYWDGFSWTFNSTAAPTTYSHAEMKYSVLDQESIARGHTSFYLKWADEALDRGGRALYKAGMQTTDQLPADLLTLRTRTIESMAAAEAAFADFRFVDAAFAAQDAWDAASTYRDRALGLEPGSSQWEQGTLPAGVAPSVCADDEEEPTEEAPGKSGDKRRDGDGNPGKKKGKDKDGKGGMGGRDEQPATLAASGPTPGGGSAATLVLGLFVVTALATRRSPRRRAGD